MGEYLDYQRDTLRYKYFVGESKEHQAKLELRTYEWLVEKYTEPGDIILDPMSGIGTVHFAASMGRSTIGIELSPRFAEIQRMNIEMIRLTAGIHADTLVLEGDCRRYSSPIRPLLISTSVNLTKIQNLPWTNSKGR